MSVGLDDDERDGEWERLKRKIEEGLEPAEERVAQKLKSHVADADTPSALVAEFTRYSELIKREGVKRALRGERESLLSAYRDLIGRITAKYSLCFFSFHKYNFMNKKIINTYFYILYYFLYIHSL